jgi:Amt family ammonium transporter
MKSFIICAIINTGLIYPIVAYWVWGGGWLMARGFQDFAGCGVVHMVGGISAFVGAWILGPRYGFEKNSKDKKTWEEIQNDPSYKNMEKEFPGKEVEFRRWIKECAEKPYKINSVMDVAAGTLILWVGWFYFNGGSALTMYKARQNSVCRIVLNTIIGGGAGGITMMIFKPLIMRTGSKYNRFDFCSLCDGIVAGLISITASCNNCDVWAAFVIGVISCPVSIIGMVIIKTLGVDDPINAAALHTSNGIWGLIACGFFDITKGVIVSGNKNERDKFFGYQLCGIVVIAAWVFSLNCVVFFIMKKCGILRVPLVDEIVGLDISECG